MSGNTQKLKACGFGFALGLIWGLAMLLLGWFGWWFHWGLAFTHVMGSMYVGFEPTFSGGIIGAIWGFVDFFIFGILVAWVYNCCTGCCGKCPVSSKSDS
jgi:hypothetical protein